MITGLFNILNISVLIYSACSSVPQVCAVGGHDKASVAVGVPRLESPWAVHMQHKAARAAASVQTREYQPLAGAFLHHRGPSPFLHTTNTSLGGKLHRGHGFPAGSEQTWAQTHPRVFWRNPHVSTYTTSPSKFSADQFLYKINLQEFRAQLKIAE